ncbi:MAG: phage virion morphogenesis protein [Lentimicrobiaceae bacterium]|nr:phage virion morphogenesis protein [Lentimicrobiaceae bacterium]
MSPEQFKIHLQRQQQSVSRAITKQLPKIIGKRAVSIFKINFQLEVFQDGGVEKWQVVKRHTNPRTIGTAKTRKILTGKTGDLGRSLKYETGVASVTVYSDVIYADVHNEGLRAGRGKGFKMPKRQFIGDSKEIDDMIEREIDQAINKILKH